MPLKSIRDTLLYCSLFGGLVIGAFYLRELSLIHVAVERIKNGLCSKGCDVHHLLTKLHPKFDILRLFLLAMCAIVLLAVAAVNRKGVLFGVGPHLKDDESAIELASIPPVSGSLSMQNNEQYSRVPNEIV